MHIPDGYLSPQTYVPAYGVMAVIWAAVSARVKRTLTDRQIPLLALSAAFAFTIMMFNVPMPGGTSGHAVGSVLVAILLGPSAACIAITIALIVQALLFGDGGVTALGANSFNMAFVMPFVGYVVYRALGGTTPTRKRFRPFVAGVAAYVGLNAAALFVAIELGIQPIIAHDAAGHALYAPYSLHVTIPAMMIGNLLAFGFVEAVVTALVVAYLQKAEPALLGITAPIRSAQGADQ
jgi:cobalt/nickel transport system permease protein